MNNICNAATPTMYGLYTKFKFTSPMFLRDTPILDHPPQIYAYHKHYEY